jgi:hypothetical protein
MSSIQSNLSSPQYGYDFVVATTQAGINATMVTYMQGLNAPVITLCYIQDEKDNPQAIDYHTLINNAKGTDPFNVPDNADLKSQAIQNLAAASFMYGFRAQIGLPPGYAPLTPGGPALPNIVVLGADTASVVYHLLCSEFIVVEAIYGPGGIRSWLNKTQPTGNAWIFTSQVDLRLTQTSDYGNLPPAVQKQIKNLGGAAFSVKQLLFDLNNAKLQTIPTISGVDPKSALCACLQEMFLGVYFTTIQKSGQPVLGYSITQSQAPPSTLTLTDLNVEVNPFMDAKGQPVSNPTIQQQDLATLCYLCAANGAHLPGSTPFSWNWIDPSEPSQYEGVISINRNTFAKYLERQLYPYISSNCYQAHCHVWLTDLGCKCHWQGTLSSGQTPTITYPPTGATVLQFSYGSGSSDQAGLHGDMGQMSLNTSLNVDVRFSGNQIVIVQHLVLYLRVQHYQSSESGNIFDKTITDTFTLSVDQNGRLTSLCATATVDNSVSLKTNWFINLFTSLNSLLQGFENWGQQFVSAHFTDIPLNLAQAFIFPGGKSLLFKSVVFSNNQDLASHITYSQQN